MPSEAVVEEAQAYAARGDARTRAAMFGFIGVLFVLTNFAAPHLGLVDIPVSFFLKNRLQLSAHQTAIFRLVVCIPLIVGFVFGFVRDSWSPFGRGDRAHLVIFSALTALIFGVVAFLHPAYAVLLWGVLLATVAFQMTSSVASGLTTILAQDNAMSGAMASASQIAAYIPQVLGYLAGGALSAYLEGRNAVVAAKTLFLVAGSIMLMVGLAGLLGPRAVFAAAERARTTNPVAHDLKRLVRHWPIYPVMAIQLLWQFSPSTGTVLQYHLSNTLHASDAQWGAWNAIFLSAFIPGYLIYAWLCRRVKLAWLLWCGFGLGIVQMVPFLFITTTAQALAAAAALGLLGALAQGSLMDLCIRSAPRGLEGTMAMMFIAAYWISFRFGDLFGTWLYDRYGFVPPVVATIISTALVLTVLPFVSRRLTATRDGEPLPLAT